MNIWLLLFATAIPGMLCMSVILKNDSKKIPIYITLLANSVLVLIFSGIGTFLNFKVLGENIFFIKNIKEVMIVGIFSSMVYMLFYYGLYKRFLNTGTFFEIENARKNEGLPARVLFVSIVEEIVFRWVIMTFIIWIISLFATVNEIVVSFAIIISSILSALTYFMNMLKIEKSQLSYSYIIIENMWIGILCGWQFWTNGILAAMIVHMLFYVLLYSFVTWNLKKNFKEMLVKKSS